MRRGTLIAIIALFTLLAIAAARQITIASNDRGPYPGPTAANQLPDGSGGPAQGTSESTPHVTDLSSAKLPRDVATRLANAHMTFTPATATGKEIPADRAAEIAREQMPLVGDTDPMVALVKYTDSAYAHENAKSNSEPSDVTPKYVDQEAWAVVYEDVQIPLVGPNSVVSVSDDSPPPMPSYSSTTVVLIDAQSGDFLEATSVG